jgi:WS/DGAT C-terminal domain
MLGCQLRAVYPVVPLADGHALSIGMTTVQRDAGFGLHADREALPDADRPATSTRPSTSCSSSADELRPCRWAGLTLKQSKYG